MERVGRYELISLLGRGGMGVVYRAYDPSLNRSVAVKVLAQPDLDLDEKSYRRFKREVQAGARLNHAHIITIFDVNLENRPPYVVMELLTGGTLTSFLANHQLDWLTALQLLRPICGALAHAHDAGIVHRDIKPDNILFASQPGEQPKLADFGLAFWRDKERLTYEGGILGTVSYLSPEQAHGKPVDARADIFSLGIILFEAITGYNPIRGKTINETLINTASLDPIDTSPLRSKVPDAVVTLLDKALAKERRNRYASCHLLGKDLDEILGERSAVRYQVEPQPLLPQLSVNNPYAISLPEGGNEIFNELFTDYRQITIEEELKGGFSGSQIFVVKPVRSDGTPELSTVVKMGPIQTIEREWQAYQDHIQNKLPGIAEINGVPVFPSGKSWGGIRYALIGKGTFYFESLASYYERGSASDLTYLLQQRLFRQLGQMWRFNTPQPGFNLFASYDHLLPVNLVIRPVKDDIQRAKTIELKAGSIPAVLPGPGAFVRLTGFEVEEVDADKQVVTLDWPAVSVRAGSYRIRLQPVKNLEQYKANLVLDRLEGVVVTTRMTALKAILLELMGIEFDKSASDLSLAGNRSLPNPLERLPRILASRPTVRLASIHGDLNPENILIDPETRDAQIIDFGSARQDHVLHDLLRLETGIVTRLLPDSLKRARLPDDAVVNLYKVVHCAAFDGPPRTSPDLAHSELEKPFAALLTIRQAAINYLFDANEPVEYYQGLTVYLLGSLKYRNLDQTAKRVAFYTAAAVQGLIDNPSPCIKIESPPAPPEPIFIVPDDEQFEEVARKSMPFESFTTPPRIGRAMEVKEWLTGNWLPVTLVGLLILVLFVIVLGFPSGENGPETVEPVAAAPTGMTTGEPAALSSPTVIEPTAILPPVNTPTTQPTAVVAASPIEIFSRESALFTLPLDGRSGETTVVLLLDTSASMRAENRLNLSLAGAIGFLERLDEKDEILAFTYGGQALLLEPSGEINTVREPMQEKLNNLFAGGEPMLYDVLCLAAEAMTGIIESDPERQIVIVLLTDGKDSGQGDISTDKEALDCLSIVPDEFSVHAIGLGSDADEDFLQELISQTNGRLYAITADNILNTFAKITFE